MYVWIWAANMSNAPSMLLSAGHQCRCPAGDPVSWWLLGSPWVMTWVVPLLWKLAGDEARCWRLDCQLPSEGPGSSQFEEDRYNYPPFRANNELTSFPMPPWFSFRGSVITANESQVYLNCDINKIAAMGWNSLRHGGWLSHADATTCHREFTIWIHFKAASPTAASTHFVGAGRSSRMCPLLGQQGQGHHLGLPRGI